MRFKTRTISPQGLKAIGGMEVSPKKKTIYPVESLPVLQVPIRFSESKEDRKSYVWFLGLRRNYRYE